MIESAQFTLIESSLFTLSTNFNMVVLLSYAQLIG